ncbi:MAG: hypothetical protein MUE32_06990 [Bacteroidales bacterium]|jgi:hypothetical protein|nr:hypothetical protein [Bacteroidales bacterium]
MRILKYTALFLIVTLFQQSCRKIETLPPEPYIEFTQFEIFDTTDILGNISKGGRLKFYFEDGDGDLGLRAPAGGASDTTNLFLTLYRKDNGAMVPAPPDDPLKPSEYRIPYMARLGQNKILRGTIAVTFIYLFAAPGDTIKYDFYIEDRALNESNVATTAEIIVTENNIYK